MADERFRELKRRVRETPGDGGLVKAMITHGLRGRQWMGDTLEVIAGHQADESIRSLLQECGVVGIDVVSHEIYQKTMVYPTLPRPSIELLAFNALMMPERWADPAKNELTFLLTRDHYVHLPPFWTPHHESYFVSEQGPPGIFRIEEPDGDDLERLQKRAADPTYLGVSVLPNEGLIDEAEGRRILPRTIGEVLMPRIGPHLLVAPSTESEGFQFNTLLEMGQERAECFVNSLLFGIYPGETGGAIIDISLHNDNQPYAHAYVPQLCLDLFDREPPRLERSSDPSASYLKR